MDCAAVARSLSVRYGPEISIARSRSDLRAGVPRPSRKNIRIKGIQDSRDLVDERAKEISTHDLFTDERREP